MFFLFLFIFLLVFFIIINDFSPTEETAESAVQQYLDPEWRSDLWEFKKKKRESESDTLPPQRMTDGLKSCYICYWIIWKGLTGV